MTSYKRIAVKIGSNVLTRPDGRLDVTRVSAIVDQVSALHKNGVEIILISSGAVASGRSEVHPSKKLDAVSARQLFSSVGQAKLINRYYELFREQGIICGQILTTKENFASRYLYLNQKNCIEVMLDNSVIPIVNENDTTSITELMFTDNDELSGLVATMIDADALIILSNVDGIYDGNPANSKSKVIREILPGKQDFSNYITDQKSSLGRGGMQTKCAIAQKVADEGIAVIIANGKKENILADVLQQTPATLCTLFVPSPRELSSVKKWIAHSEDFAKGIVYINKGAEEALRDDSKASSLLPVGISRIDGHFDEGDIVKIATDQGETIGVGKVQYDSDKALALMGKKGHKPLVHYDYLSLDL
jgi:glutamate 5-kinase